MRLKIRILPTGARSLLSINKSRQYDIAFLKECNLSYHLMANKDFYVVDLLIN